MGWHMDEFDFMGVEFKGRGRRANEAIRLMRALWNGKRSSWAMRGIHRAAPMPTMFDASRSSIRNYA
jgi:alkanesulfonate monooxygenase SsuD/methylene tetrahydromethanopterin reductase-like flavin-dependent oxidoreductase (luciferase family)